MIIEGIVWEVFDKVKGYGLIYDRDMIDLFKFTSPTDLKVWDEILFTPEFSGRGVNEQRWAKNIRPR